MSPPLTAPPRIQELLLKAAVLPEDESRAAWDQWNKEYDLSLFLRQSTVKLLPAVGRTFLERGVEVENLGLLKGLCRQAWYKNNMLLAQGVEISEELRRQGIETLFLKGSALVMLGIFQGSDRRLSDIDLLVPFHDRERALSLLQEAGWVPEHPITHDLLSFTHGAHFMKGDYTVDLHWFLMEEWHSIAVDEEVWQRSTQLTWQGHSARVPSITDLLLHVCINGYRTYSLECAWALDALRIIRHERDRVDWPLLLRLARERRITGRVFDALRYVSQFCPGEIPESVFTTLEQQPPDTIARLESLKPPHPLGGLSQHLASFLRRRPVAPAFLLPLRFISFMRYQWSAESWGACARILCARVLTFFKRLLHRSETT